MSALAGKLALVTGASGTIGKAIAKTLAFKGASLVLIGRNETRVQEAASDIRKALAQNNNSSTTTTTPSLQCISCDVTNEQAVVGLFKTLDSQSQVVDILVNTAGVNVAGQTVDLSGDDFDWVMKVNVLGPFLCSREAMKRMKERKKRDEKQPQQEEEYVGGKIINIGSLSAISPRPDSAPYTTSKFALLGLTKSLALDGSPFQISVGIIHPGNVESELLTEEMIEARKSEGFLSAQEVADCVLTMALLPPSANVLEVTLLPTQQPLVGRG